MRKLGVLGWGWGGGVSRWPPTHTTATPKPYSSIVSNSPAIALSLSPEEMTPLGPLHLTPPVEGMGKEAWGGWGPYGLEEAFVRVQLGPGL